MYRTHTAILDDLRRLGTAYNVYTHTNTKRHTEQVQLSFHRLLDRDGVATTVYTSLQVLSSHSALLAPCIPHASQRLRELLGGTGAEAHQPWQLEVVPSGRALPTSLVARLEAPAPELVPL